MAVLVPEVSTELVLVRAAAADLRAWEVSVVVAVAVEVSVAVVAVAAGEVLVAVAAVAVVVVVAVGVEGGKDHETKENNENVKTIPRGKLDRYLLHSVGAVSNNGCAECDESKIIPERKRGS